MENQVFESPQISESGGAFKNVIIMILIVVLILSLLGINIFIIFGNGLQKLIDIFNPVVSKGLSEA